MHSHDPAGTGTLLGGARAELVNEDAVAMTCFSEWRNHRFRFQITEAQRRHVGSQHVFCYIIYPVGGENPLVGASGVQRIPVA